MMLNVCHHGVVKLVQSILSPMH